MFEGFRNPTWIWLSAKEGPCKAKSGESLCTKRSRIAKRLRVPVGEPFLDSSEAAEHGNITIQSSYSVPAYMQGTTPPQGVQMQSARCIAQACLQNVDFFEKATNKKTGLPHFGGCLNRRSKRLLGHRLSRSCALARSIIATMSRARMCPALVSVPR